MYLTDKQVIDKLYEGEYEAVIFNYMNMAFYIADRVARRSWTHETKDIRGEALLALVEGVYLLRGHDNPRAFLRLKIHGAVINYVQRQHTVYTPQGKEVHSKWAYLEDIEQEWSNSASIPKECQEPFDKQGDILANDMIDGVFFSDLEKKVLRMKIEGLTIEEIALECKFSYSAIQRMIKDMRNRVVDVLNGEY